MRDTLDLPDGTTIDYDTYGDPDGRPVLAWHGTPSASSIWQPLDDAARAAGVRLVAPNRPGIRGSSRLHHHDVAAASALGMALVEELGLDEVAVLGWSGGGPFALGCGAVAADRVTRIVVVAGVEPPGPDSDPIDRDDAKLEGRAHHAPLLARAALAVEAAASKHAPEQALAAITKELPPVDAAELAAYPGWSAMGFFTEAFEHGTRGVVDDYWCLSSPWGFELADVTAPVQVFWGDADTEVPCSHAEHIADGVVDGSLEVLPGLGHFCVVAEAPRILAATAG